ncbi:MAG TPA: hypothetical protein VGR31_13930 [Planctomycetota bacterium]|jgi:hypothetical protein|nr:hypothetical protein [Planctomycetota bacterium]
MWRVPATALGIVLACVPLAGAALVLLGPNYGPYPPVDLALEDPAVAQPCIGEDSILRGSQRIPILASSSPLSEPVVEQRFERDRGTAFVRYSSHRSESRCLSLVLRSGSVRVEARFDTEHGRYYGEVQRTASHVHLEGNELCFDLTVGLNDVACSQERWQGKIPMR